ncbi:unnamed protein product [Symbiodinium sp. CCMP2456]|nr:unnamed protein product [Symbiodinium sp. CCMP2456]
MRVNWTAPDPLEGTKFYSIQLEWAHSPDRTFEYRSVIAEVPVGEVDYQIPVAPGLAGTDAQGFVLDAVSASNSLDRDTYLGTYPYLYVFTKSTCFLEIGLQESMSRSSLFEQTTPVGLTVSDTSPQITNIEFSDQARDQTVLAGSSVKVNSVKQTLNADMGYVFVADVRRGKIGKPSMRNSSYPVLDVPIPRGPVHAKPSLDTGSPRLLSADRKDLDVDEIGGNLTWTENSTYECTNVDGRAITMNRICTLGEDAFAGHIQYSVGDGINASDISGGCSNATNGSNLSGCQFDEDTSTSTTSSSISSTTTAITQTSTTSSTQTQTATSTTSTTTTGFTALTRSAQEHPFVDLNLYATAQISIVGTNADPYLPDDNITLSNPLLAAKKPEEGRLDGSGQFCNLVLRKTTYIEFDFGTDMLIERIETKGRETIFQWVSKFSLSYTRNGYTWFDLPQVYEANNDRTTLVENIILPHSFLAMKLRLNQLEYFSFPCMRVDIFGCKRADTVGVEEINIPLETDFTPYDHILFFMASSDYLLVFTQSPTTEGSTPTSIPLIDNAVNVTNVSFVDYDLDADHIAGVLNYDPPEDLSDVHATQEITDASMHRTKGRLRQISVTHFVLYLARAPAAFIVLRSGLHLSASISIGSCLVDGRFERAPYPFNVSYEVLAELDTRLWWVAQVCGWSLGLKEQTYPVILELDNADSPAVNISYIAEDLNLDDLAGTVEWDHPDDYSKVLEYHTELQDAFGNSPLSVATTPVTASLSIAVPSMPRSIYERLAIYSQSALCRSTLPSVLTIQGATLDFTVADLILIDKDLDEGPGW